jgi:glycosyltransferase involved in cell wall biosynthesis
MVIAGRIIFVNRYYWPDHSATAQLLTDLAEKVAQGNNSVIVVAGRQLYENPKQILPHRETLNGVDVHRIWTTRFGRANLLGRAVDYVSFYLSCLFHLLTHAKCNDILVMKTDPPMISVIGAIVSKLKNTYLVNWLQDLFPEVAQELGIRALTPLLFRNLKAVRDWSLRAADKNIALGNLMAERINICTMQPEKTLVIPNWVINSELSPISPEKNLLRHEWQLSNKFVVVYSGNLGRAHDYKTFFQAASALRENNNIVFVFIGGGAGLVELKSLVEIEGLCNVLFKPYQPSTLLAQSLSLADIHLVSLEPRLEGLIVPSKLYGILAVGRPLIFIGARNGEIGQIINNYRCGITISPGDWQTLAIQIEKLADNRQNLKGLSDNARELFNLEFSDGKSILRWQQALDINALSSKLCV